MASELTSGMVAAPLTLCPAASAMAWLPRPSVAFVLAALWMVPLFRVRAPAAMPMPFGSTSVASTV